MSRISEYAALGTVQSDDLLVVVDVHDTTMASTGTTKKMTLSQVVTLAQAQQFFAPTGITGATSASRYVGATASGAPASGTFAVGDFIIDRTGKLYICTTAGSPGTWTQAGTTIPLTTLGDLLYEDATPALARLAGNTTSTRKFLAQTGTGSVSAAPAWASIAPSDLSVTFPWRFYVDDPAYGAKGDGRVLSDVATTASSANITSASAGFTSADTGKHIMINGALGSTSGPLAATMTFVNSTTVSLSVTPTATLTSAVAVYGTDDTSAINSAVTAAGAYATAHGYFAEVVFGARIYMLASGPAQTGNGSTTPTFNAQVPLPYPAAAGTSQKLVIALTGAGDAGFVQYWESTTPNLAGTVLVSTTTAPSPPSATFGEQSVIGGPSGSAGFTGGFANVKAVVWGIEVVCGAYTNQYAYDFGYCSAMRIQQSSAHIFAPSGVNGGNSPLLKDLPSQVAFQSTIGAGLRSPVTANNADAVADDFTVEGYARALYLFDHFTAGRVFTFYNDVAVKIDLTQGASGTSHGVFIGLLGAEVYNGGISTTGSGAYCPVYINLDAEVAAPAYDISDAGNNLHGIVHWTDPADSRTPGVTGAANLKVVNDKLGPGAWSGQPAVPATTVAQQNTAWRDAAVSIKGGTVTVVAVDGVTVATATGTTVIVPAGKNITLTYSVAPTWAWTLL